MDQTSTILGFAGLAISMTGAFLIVNAPGWGDRGYRKQAALAHLLGLVLVVIGLIIMCARNEIYAAFSR